MVDRYLHVGEDELLLLSLHPRHSSNILLRHKTIELRKRPPKQGIKPYVLFYETLPTGAIVGMFKVREIICGYADFFQSFQKDLCLTQKSIEDYLSRDKGYGLVIDAVFESPNIPLEDMKKAGYLPPQGYRYLKRSDLDKMGILLHVDKIIAQA